MFAAALPRPGNAAGAAAQGVRVFGLLVSGTGSGGSGAFIAGDIIEVRLQFNNIFTTISGTPRIALWLGAATRYALYHRQSEGNFFFRYQVQSTDEDTDGISIGASALELNGGTIRALGFNANLSLSGYTVTNDRNFVVDGDGDRGPRATGLTFSGTAQGASNTFIAGDVIRARVRFSEAVTVTGAPRLGLTIGSAVRNASYSSAHSSGADVVFLYTVVSGDSDTGGLSVTAGALSLNGGTIRDSDNHNAALTLTAVTNTGPAVNGAAADVRSPAVAGVTPSGIGNGSGGAFLADEVIRVTVTFDEAVTVTGTPQVALTIGATTRQAAYASGSGTTSLVFRYTVVTADSDSNGISIGASALALGGGTIRDGANNNAALSLGSHAISDDADFPVDGNGADVRGPKVSGVSLSGTAQGASGVFITGDVLEVTVEFDELATVTGTPRVELTIGSAARYAAYASGSGAASLVFRYTVESGDTDADGVSIGASALALNGGAIRDASNNDASLGLGDHAITDGNVVVDGSAADAVAPTVTGVSLSGSVPQGASGVFIAGDRIEVTVEFSERVTVTGTPQVAILVGVTTRQADYASGSGTDSLVFRYTVVTADTDSNGISIAATALALNGGTIVDSANNAATLGLGTHAVTNDSNFTVNGGAADAVGPSVTGLLLDGSGQGSGGTFVAEDAITVFVYFDEAVVVTGTPQVALTVGTVTRQAGYVSGSRTRILAFRYEVVSGDTDANGISIGASALALNSGTLRDAANNNAALGLGTHAVTDDGDFVVNGSANDVVRPTVAGLTAAPYQPGSGASGALIAGDTISVTVTFSERVAVTGTPRVALTIGSATRYADWVSAAGREVEHEFRYTVVTADEDANGISIGTNALQTNGGTIRDRGNNNADLGLGSHAITDGDVVVDGNGTDVVAPTVAGVTVSGLAQGASGVYIAGDDLVVTVEFNEAVVVTGTPQVALTVGANTRQASYASGSGTTSPVFRYTVVAGDTDADGVSVGASALALNSGTIQDRAGNNATLGLGTHAISNGDAVVNGGAADARAPRVVSASLSAAGNGDDAAFIAGDPIRVALVFDEPVTVTTTGGTPRLALTIGSATRYAAWSGPASSSASQQFRYTTREADAAPDGLRIGAAALGLNGGTIADAAGNNAVPGLGSVDFGEVERIAVDGDGEDARAPFVTGISVSGRKRGGPEVFIAGDVIEVEVRFHKPVTVSGRPRVEIGMTGGNRHAVWASAGSDPSRQLFRYPVVAADEDADGISIGANALGLNGGTIRDRRGQAAALDLDAFDFTNDTSAKVDGDGSDAAPRATTFTFSGAGEGASGAFIAGDVIRVAVDFSEPVTASGAVRLGFTVGTTERLAGYRSGSGTDSLTFAYVVQSADEDTDGLELADPHLRGTILDDRRNGRDPLSTSHSVVGASSIRVDGDGADVRAPTVAGMEVSAASPGNGPEGVYIAGDALEVVVVFSEEVTVTGAPRVALTVGSTTRQADYASGSGTTRLAFRYAVVSGDEDTNGISIGAAALALNGGTIADRAAAPNNANLSLAGFAITDGNARVDGDASDRRAPTVAGLSVRAARPVNGASGVFIAGDVIEVEVRFSEPVSVSGRPQVSLTIGNSRRPAVWHSAGADRRLQVFRYTVQWADEDADGIGIGSSALTLSGGRIRERVGGGKDARLSLSGHAFDNDAGVVVDGDGTDVVAASVTGVSVSAAYPGNGAGGAYIAGDVIQVEVSFSEPVTVTGTPQLALAVGSAARRAAYASGSGTATLVFRYEVASGDTDSDGIGIGSSALTLNGGTIAGGGGAAAGLGLGAHAFANDANFPVAGSGADGRAPTVTGVTLSGSGSGPGGAFAPGDEIAVEVRFSEPVRVTGRPVLRLTLSGGPTTARAGSSGVLRRGQGGAPGARTVEAAYAGQTEDRRGLRFGYRVRPGDEDANGISIGSGALALNGGTIRDGAAAPNAANLVLGVHAVADDGQFAVVPASGGGGGGGPASPRLASLAIVSNPADGETYRAGESIEIAASFNRPVFVSGAPRLDLTVGDRTRKANYGEGTGTDRLVFRYPLVSGDRDEDGIAVPADPIRGGEIRTADRGSVALTHPGLADDPAHRVDARTPPPPPPPPPPTALTVEGVSLTSRPADGAAYRAGETITVEVAFSAPASVSGSASLRLNLGGSLRTAAYAGGSGTAVWRFAYRVEVPDWDEDGVEAPANGLSGGISGEPDQPVALRHPAVAGGPAHRVRGIEPLTVREVRISSTPPDGAAYRVGQTIEVSVEFSSDARVSGAPSLPLTVGFAARPAGYRSGSGTPVLRFAYRVVEGDWDEDGVSVPKDAVPPTLSGVPGQRAALGHAPLADQREHPVRAISPPRAVGTLPALTLVAGAEPHPVEVAAAFLGAERYASSSSAPGVASTALAGAATVSVSPLSEGEASVTVTASNRAGSATQSFAVTVRSDPVEAAAVAETLAAMGRGLLSSASEVIGRRIEARGGGGSRVAMGALSGGNGGRPAGGPGNAGPGVRSLFRGERPLEDAAAVEGYDPLRDSFALSFGPPDGGGAAAEGGGPRGGLWGAGDLVSFEGASTDGSTTYSGDLRTPFLGLDVAGKSWLVGIAMARAWGGADYAYAGAATGTGATTARITGVLPYASLRPTGWAELWAIGGAGRGTLTTDRGDRGQESRDLALGMGLVGLRLRVAGSGQGFSLAIRGDAGLSRLTTSDGASGSGAGVSGGLEGRAFRLRAGAETRLRLRLGGGSAIEPFAAVSARADGETEVEGRGLEVSGGLRLTAGSRFRLEAQGRMLAAYSEEGFRERGAGVTALLQSKASGEGLSFSLAPAWGGRGRQDALWRPDAALLAGRRFDRRTEGGRFEARLGYGLPAGRLPGVLTPFGDYGAGDGRSRARVGVRYGDPLSRGRAFDLEFAGERSAYGETAPVLRLGFRGTLRF